MQRGCKKKGEVADDSRRDSRAMGEKMAETKGHRGR